MMATASKPEEAAVQKFEQHPIYLRLATPDDFRVEVYTENSGLVKSHYKPKYGQPYWIYSKEKGKFDNRNYQISEDTDWVQFREQMKFNQVYVPAGYFELKDAGIC